jgi:hypothetical protein
MHACATSESLCTWHTARLGPWHQSSTTNAPFCAALCCSTTCMPKTCAAQAPAPAAPPPLSHQPPNFPNGNTHLHQADESCCCSHRQCWWVRQSLLGVVGVGGAFTRQGYSHLCVYGGGGVVFWCDDGVCIKAGHQSRRCTHQTGLQSSAQ